jgi:hypothetical protein
VLYVGEGHGFVKESSVVDSVQQELKFYTARRWGSSPRCEMEACGQEKLSMRAAGAAQ